MRKVSLPSFLAITMLLAGFSRSFAQDTLVHYGANIAGANQWKYKGGGTNLNAVAWKDISYPETGWQTGNSAFGFGGTPFRNTTIPQDNSAGGGGASGARY